LCEREQKEEGRDCVDRVRREERAEERGFSKEMWLGGEKKGGRKGKRRVKVTGKERGRS
jgi:hypothetical protein